MSYDLGSLGRDPKIYEKIPEISNEKPAQIHEHSILKLESSMMRKVKNLIDNTLPEASEKKFSTKELSTKVTPDNQSHVSSKDKNLFSGALKATYIFLKIIVRDIKLQVLAHSAPPPQDPLITKPNNSKLQVRADQISVLVKEALKGKVEKTTLSKQGSIEIDLKDIGKVTVLKTKSRNPFRKGSLFIRLGEVEGGKLGSGSFKDVELGIHLNHLNQAIPVAIARANQSDQEGKTNKELRKEHENSIKMKKLFGDRIFASHQVIPIGGKEIGFVMPLSHGDYLPLKADRGQDIGLRIPTQKKIENARGILETIHKMSDKGWAHGDFKGDNIFRDSDHNAMMADWGGALLNRKDFEEPRRTELLAQIQEEIGPEGFSIEAKWLEEGSFDNAVEQAELQWAHLVYESFSKDEWKIHKSEIVDMFKDVQCVTWPKSDGPPEKTRKKAS